MLTHPTDMSASYGRDCTEGCGCLPRSITALYAISALAREGDYRQEGSQICMFHVDCEIGMPVKIGYIHAKFVITSAT